MKKGKASETSSVVTEMLLASDDAGLERVTILWKRISSELDSSVITN